MHGLVVIAFMAATTYVPDFRVWPWLWLVPIVGYGVLVAAVPPLRATFRPWCVGEVSTGSVIATLIIAVGSCCVLVAFHVLTQPDVGTLGRYFPVSALGSVIVAGVLFSVFNAIFEEIIFREIVFDAVESRWGVRVAVIATAVLFGYGHMQGYPPGILGAILAGTYGLCLGWLRAFTGGIGLPILAHIAADATIFVIVARSGIF